MNAYTAEDIFFWPLVQVERRPYLLVPMALLWLVMAFAAGVAVLLATVGTLFWLLAAAIIWLAKRWAGAGRPPTRMFQKGK